MNQFPRDTAEWLAHEALHAAGGSTATATERVRMAGDVLLLWQRMAFFDAQPGPAEPRRG